MYAVVETGGKQYRVSPGDIVRIEKIDKPVGEKVELDKVLLVSGDDKVSVGETLKDAKVIGEVAAQGRERKVIIFKKKRRKGYQRTKGHRQYYTSVKITEIQS
ncbi:MAG TPA: 50S ribosomal protein L21 [Nitrospiria bacterium]|nr:50S ribosomal protein L21 [Nitrospiria bacterium]